MKLEVNIKAIVVLRSCVRLQELRRCCLNASSGFRILVFIFGMFGNKKEDFRAWWLVLTSRSKAGSSPLQYISHLQGATQPRLDEPAKLFGHCAPPC